MTRNELFTTACIAVGIDQSMAVAAAQAFERLEAGLPARGSASELVAEMREKAAAAFDWEQPPGQRMTATEVCRLVGVLEPSRAQQTAMGIALTELTKRRAFKTNGRHVYVLPRVTPVTLP